MLLRKAATVSTPVCHISEEAGVWTIKSSTTLKSTELKFKVGGLASDGVMQDLCMSHEKNQNLVDDHHCIFSWERSLMKAPLMAET